MSGGFLPMNGVIAGKLVKNRSLSPDAVKSLVEFRHLVTLHNEESNTWKHCSKRWKLKRSTLA